MLHLVLSGWVSSERTWHQDDYLNPDFVNSHYAAVWVALRDISPDCGPFQFVRGSHKWPLTRRDKVLANCPVKTTAADPAWPTKNPGLGFRDHRTRDREPGREDRELHRRRRRRAHLARPSCASRQFGERTGHDAAQHDRALFGDSKTYRHARVEGPLLHSRWARRRVEVGRSNPPMGTCGDVGRTRPSRAFARNFTSLIGWSKNRPPDCYPRDTRTAW